VKEKGTLTGKERALCGTSGSWLWALGLGECRPCMTEWNAAGYGRIAHLQERMAADLGLLNLEGSERVLDVGCGNGKVTARIASLQVTTTTVSWLRYLVIGEL